MLLAFVGAQFFRPLQNDSDIPAKRHITADIDIPPGVHDILKTSCYDCHSSSTVYPWYAHVQPVGWWLNDHIETAKEELNFSEFATYSPRRQYRKFQEIVEQVETEEMPLPSYLFLHFDAKLDNGKKEALLSWSRSMMTQMEETYPADSLVGKK